MHWEKKSEVAVCIGSFVCLFLSYATYTFLNKLSFSEVIDDIGRFFFLFFILAFLTPVLQSLTVTYASDTVCMWVMFFGVSHLWAYDYSSKGTGVLADKTEVVVRSPTSLNAIFVAAILLSSRLTRFISVFFLLFQSLLLFGFGPYMRKKVRSYSRTYYELMTVSGSLILFTLIFALNHLMGVIYLSVVLLVALGGPFLFIYAYRFKK